MNFHKSSEIQLIRHVFWSTEYPPQPKIKGLAGKINVDRPAPVSCHIDYFVTDDVKMAWSLSNKEFPSFPLHITNHDNMAKYNSTLNYTFTREDHGEAITCSFSDMGNLRYYEKSTAGVVDLLCKCKANNCEFEATQVH